MTNFLDAVAIIVCSLVVAVIVVAWIWCLSLGPPPLKFVAWAVPSILIVGWALGRANDFERRRIARLRQRDTQ